MKIRLKKPNMMLGLMVFFSMSPFVLPVPGMGTDLQPYALLLSLFVLFLYYGYMGNALGSNIGFLLLMLPVAMALIFVIAAGFSFGAFRGAYNHLSILFVLMAWFVLLTRYGFPEEQIKMVLWLWFFVATVQFLFDRSFLASIISGDREAAFGRGVVGLCSEASFFGISCFYFLHLANKFTKKKVLYLLLITMMAVLYAQSMQGVLFVLVFYVGFALESVKKKRGIFIVIGIVVGCILSFIIVQKVAPESRLVELLESFRDEGVSGTIDGDASATTRMNSIQDALKEAFGNFLIPQGFARRIGSGFGGLLVELGVFGLLETLVIAYYFSLHFKRLYTRVIYFLLIYFIMFSNTQMGNPQMLFALATNLYFSRQERSNENAVTIAR